MTEALIARHDAQARRTASQISALIAGHYPAKDVRAAWDAMKAAISQRTERVPGELAPLVMKVLDDGPAAVERVLERHMRVVLSELAGSGPNPVEVEPVPASSDPTLDAPEPCPRSRTLDAARARAARLRARLIELQDRRGTS